MKVALVMRRPAIAPPAYAHQVAINGDATELGSVAIYGDWWLA
jgi:hypothetical protein